MGGFRFCSWPLDLDADPNFDCGFITCLLTGQIGYVTTIPAWFSGTACLGLLYGSTSVVPNGDYIISATISVGGTVVKRYPEDYLGILPPSGQASVPNLAAVWDSNLFNGTRHCKH